MKATFCCSCKTYKLLRGLLPITTTVKNSDVWFLKHLYQTILNEYASKNVGILSLKKTSHMKVWTGVLNKVPVFV